MPIDFDDVRPGDLITADFINHVTQTLEDLDARVTELESQQAPDDGRVRIETVVPSGVLQVGQEIVVIGQNFGFSLGAHRVSISGQSVNSFGFGSSDGQLVFNVPSIPNLDGDTPVTLRVDNVSQNEFDTYPLVVAEPQAPLDGIVNVSFSAFPSSITPGAQATFGVEIESQLSRSVTLNLSPSVEGGTSPVSSWTDAVVLRDSAGNEILNGLIDLAAGATETLSFTIDPIPSGTSGVSFTVRLDTTTAETSTTWSAQQSFTVDAPVIEPDPDIAVGSITLTNGDDGHSLDGSTVTVLEGGTAVLSVQVTFSAAGTYNLLPAVTGSESGWEVNLGIQQPSQIIVSSADITNSSVQTPVTFVVVASQGAEPSSGGRLRIQEENRDRYRDLIFDTELQT